MSKNQTDELRGLYPEIFSTFDKDPKALKMLCCLVLHMGNVTKACKCSGYSRQNHYRMVKGNDQYREFVENVIPAICTEVAESSLFKLIQGGTYVETQVQETQYLDSKTGKVKKLKATKTITKEVLPHAGAVMFYLSAKVKGYNTDFLTMGIPSVQPPIIVFKAKDDCNTSPSQNDI